jgi:hypothetical protein
MKLNRSKRRVFLGSIRASRVVVGALADHIFVLFGVHVGTAESSRRGRRLRHARARVLPRPQNNFHHEGHEGHEGEKNEISLKESNSIGLFLFALFAPFVVKILPLKN